MSKEQIAAAKTVPILDYVLANEPDNIKRVGNEYRLKDHSVTMSNGKWHWQSRHIGGEKATALNYLIIVRGFGFVEAVRHLVGDDVQNYTIPPKSKSPPEHVPFSLPMRNRDNIHIVTYLQSRGIEKSLILGCIERGSLYQSAVYNNCVFVGRDGGGKARFAALRGTKGNFKSDVAGSDKRFGFVLPPVNPVNCDSIAVFESGIDCLSHQTMCDQGIIEPFDGWRLSLGGTALIALTHFLDQHNEIKNCVICTDNDEAGNKAAVKITVLPGIATMRSPPIQGKDWNEALRIIKKEVDHMEDVRQDIRFISSKYVTLFSIKDGDNIKITSGYDGEEMVRKCRFIDEYHTEVGNNTYHICEFAERMEQVGNIYEPLAKQERKIDVLSAKYGEALQESVIPMTVSAFKKLVGGKYEVTPLRYSNGNIAAAQVSGTEGIVVCGIKDDTLTSIHPYTARMYMRELSPAQMPVNEAKKPSLLGKLDSVKEKIADQKAVNDHCGTSKKHDPTELG